MLHILWRNALAKVSQGKRSAGERAKNSHVGLQFY